VFDYLLTLDLEIQWIWKSRWSVVRVLYHLLRFFPFFSLSVILFTSSEFRRSFLCTVFVTIFCS
ncbi:hypothetical protein AMATHDRAFT_163085, partial [Amanita thiersii Skay4041]